ncbi:MAG: BON domain-containing protein [Chloroflexota bacterium]
MAFHIDTDSDIQREILDELSWDPRVEPEEIGVAVGEGVVTLTGSVDSYSKKIAAEQAAHRVRGVKAVANDLVVRLPIDVEVTDTDLARSITSSLERHVEIPTENLDVTVAAGWVTLKGELPWRFQRDAAEQTIRALKGVKGITNLVRANPTVKPANIRIQIEQALVRSAQTDARRIHVETEGPEVTLKGSVRTLTEWREAEQAAWLAPGVTQVDNRIVVMPEICE